jgi:hypothetical protein
MSRDHEYPKLAAASAFVAVAVVLTVEIVAVIKMANGRNDPPAQPLSIWDEAFRRHR